MDYLDTTAHDALPRCIKPTHYDLRIYDIDQIQNTFKGSVEIQFDVTKSTKTIYLHQKKIDILKATAFLEITKTKTELIVEKITPCDPDDKSQTVKIDFTESLKEGAQLILSIDYSGEIREDMAGFYNSTYKDEKDQDMTILITQFEATDARSAFPCFDEPNAKATFDVTITVDSQYDILGNMPVESVTEENALKTVKFEKTPLMSTYLLAWAIGKFEYIESFTEKLYNGRKLPVRVYTNPGVSETGRFALDVATKVVDFLSDIFKKDYVLPKLDLLAVPSFGANAMENFGLVTFRSTALLYDPATSDISYQKKVAYVVSHEILHQWFGNLVTMNWWNELWLNEGFATWGGQFVVDQLFPDRRVMENFVAAQYQDALTLDALRSSHPIEVPVYYSYQIDEVFDPISYLKGASCIRMLVEVLGLGTFLAGIADYLDKFAYGNAKTQDLWDSLSRASCVDIGSLMNSWIKAQGFPYLYVETTKKEGEYKVTQKRFLLPDGPSEEENAVKWFVPLQVKSAQVADSLSEGQESVIISPGNIPFLKLNSNSTGFYRVFYEPFLLDEILENLDKLSTEDKIGLVADTASGAIMGLVPTSSLLDMVKRLKNDSSYALWAAITTQLSTIRNNLFEAPALAAAFKKFEADIYEPKFKELLFLHSSTAEFDSFEIETLIPLLFKTLGAAGSSVAAEFAQSKFSSGSIAPNLRSSVFSTLMSNPSACTENVYDALVKETLVPSTIDAREVALSALGSVSNPKLFSRVFDLFFTESVPNMDAIYLATSLATNPKAKNEFWCFFRDNYTKFVEKYPMWTFDRVLKTFLPKLVSKSLYEDIQKTMEGKNTDGFEKGLKQALDAINTALVWIERDQQDISNWLSKNKYL